MPKEIKKYRKNKNIITNINRIQAYDSIMCGYFCIKFIDFMLKGKGLLVYATLVSPNESEKNDKKVAIKNYIVLFAVSIENLINLKYPTS